jgi:polynucleotide 5'-kinase involved in rRNA processing
MYICRFEHSSSARFLTAHHHARYAHPLASQVLAPTPTLVVGLTGGIATGKSTVSARLRGAQIPVVDADVLARDVVAPGTRALAQIERQASSTARGLARSCSRTRARARG